MEEVSISQPATIKVLLADDHPTIRMGIRAILERSGNIEIVGEATNGQEAVVNTGQLKPDVVLMDVSMPVMDGIQATREILKTMPGVRIIMLTSHDNESHALAAFAAGAQGYCLKDVQPDRLHTAITSVYAGDAWLDSAVASKVLQRQADKGAPSISSANSPFELLSPRELEVLELIVEGQANKEISKKLEISLPTVKAHVRNILDKLAVDDRTQAAVYAMRQGLISSKS
jgi:DNA-binding NarL/FixJ family response regulator